MVNRICIVLLAVSLLANAFQFIRSEEHRELSGKTWLRLSRKVSDAEASETKAEAAAQECHRGWLGEKDRSQRFAARVKAMSDLFLEESVK